jgi:hypothetical protein
MPFISENELERALVEAVKQPASAQNFYRLLLDADLLVMGTVEGQEDTTSEFRLGPGGKLNLVTGIKNGGMFLPVFSSLVRMQEYVKQESKYLRMNGRSLLDLARGAPVILNPASEYGKELSPEQVAQLLDPPVSRNRPSTLIGETEYPMPLVETLTEVFTARPEIEAAWMIQLNFGDLREPHPLVGIETEGDWPSLVQIIEVAAEQALPGLVFDLQHIDRQRPNSVTDTLLQVPPFYQRRSGGSRLN